MSKAEIRANDNAADRLEQALAGHPGVPFDTIGFRLNGRRIELIGHVGSLDEKAAIYEVIDDFALIRDIDDRLQVAMPTPMDLPLAA